MQVSAPDMISTTSLGLSTLTIFHLSQRVTALSQNRNPNMYFVGAPTISAPMHQDLRHRFGLKKCGLNGEKIEPGKTPTTTAAPFRIATPFTKDLVTAANTHDGNTSFSGLLDGGIKIGSTEPIQVGNGILAARQNNNSGIR